MNDLTYISILADEKRKVKNIFSCKNPLKWKAFWKRNKNLKFFKKVVDFFLWICYHMLATEKGRC